MKSEEEAVESNSEGSEQEKRGNGKAKKQNKTRRV